MHRDYEILYIVRPDVEEADLGDITKRIETLIETLDGSIQRTNVWGKRRLAYEVDRLNEGHYVLTDFQIEPARVPEMEATLKISDTVFRHLIVRRPPEKVLATVAATPTPEAEAEGSRDEIAEPAVAATSAAHGTAQPAEEGK